VARHNRQLLSLWIGLLFIGERASALGLGDLQVHSHLGEPLDAQVQLLEQDVSGGDDVLVKLGSSADYQALGLEYSSLHAQLSFETLNQGGQSFLRIRTQAPVNEPYLDFVVRLRDPHGQLVRNLTILLDPAPLQAQTLSNQSPISSVTSTPVAKSQPAKAPRPSFTPADTATAPVRAGTDSYRVKAGDSLWKIAAQTKSATVGQDEAMAAIFALNPKAFIAGDPSRLKQGAKLVLPAAAPEVQSQQVAAVPTDVVAPVQPAVVNPVAQVQAVAPAQGGATAAQVPAMASVDASLGAEQQALAALNEQKATLAAEVQQLSETLAHLNMRLASANQTIVDLEGKIPDVGNSNTSVVAPAGATAAPVAATQSDSPMPFMMVQTAAAAEELHKSGGLPWWNLLVAWLSAGGLGFWLARKLQGDKSAADLADNQARLAWPLAKSWRTLRAQEASAVEVKAQSDKRANFNLPVSSEPEAVTDLSRELDSHINVKAAASQLIAFGNYKEAEALLTKALARDEDVVSLQLLLLNVFMQTHRLAKYHKLMREIERSQLSAEEQSQLVAIKANYEVHHGPHSPVPGIRRVI